MKRLVLTAVFRVATIVLSDVEAVFADEHGRCPERLIIDFKVPVSTREVAIELFSRAFPSDKGFPPFDEKELRGPYLDDPAVPPGTYSYFGWYGHGAEAVGGLLYPDGRLVQRGYCK
jgi:hypothetical protein